MEDEHVLELDKPLYEKLQKEMSRARFLGWLCWLPSGMWIYIIAAVLLLFIWLFYPILFILGLVLLILWFVN